MKYLKTFEREIRNSYLRDALERFFNNYKDYKNKYFDSYYTRSLDQAKIYKMPEFLYEEFATLYFLYEHKGWLNIDSSIYNSIKTLVKNQMIESIIDKIEKEPEYYFQLKDVLDKRPNFNNPGSFNKVYDIYVRYIFFLLHTVIKKTPDWVKDSNKFNL